jgi:Zn finger protein HypA/HybF involved in hydrogenase expression
MCNRKLPATKRVRTEVGKDDRVVIAIFDVCVPCAAEMVLESGPHRKFLVEDEQCECDQCGRMFLSVGLNTVCQTCEEKT